MNELRPGYWCSGESAHVFVGRENGSHLRSVQNNGLCVFELISRARDRFLPGTGVSAAIVFNEFHGSPAQFPLSESQWGDVDTFEFAGQQFDIIFRIWVLIIDTNLHELYYVTHGGPNSKVFDLLAEGHFTISREFIFDKHFTELVTKSDSIMTRSCN
jgi:hypothetical protein